MASVSRSASVSTVIGEGLKRRRPGGANERQFPGEPPKVSVPRTSRSVALRSVALRPRLLRPVASASSASPRNTLARVFSQMKRVARQRLSSSLSERLAALGPFVSVASVASPAFASRKPSQFERKRSMTLQSSTWRPLSDVVESVMANLASPPVPAQTPRTALRTFRLQNEATLSTESEGLG